ncbi:hypothetical protein Zmor_009387 [Zophobas morio]|uniref:Uncharacterized protein n=2 Tax=Zophobas morio TaxID=2755281 RepID=A0AA38IQL1_9CUCU|nr:hypothetical protein Zmor_009387 [Zophobas morio]
MEAENQKAESGREHQRRATIFKTAEDCVKQLESRLQKSIIKSRPYFDEKSLCQSQLNTQKDRIETIKRDIVKAKTSYSQTLKQLEQISNEIHMKRGSITEELLRGPREPGVGAELVPSHEELTNKHSTLPDFNLELDKCELRSCGSMSGTNSSAVSEKDERENLYEDLDDLKVKFKELAVRPVNGGEGESMDGVWESELKNTVEKMDHMMLLQECAQELDDYKSGIRDSEDCSSVKQVS